MFEVAETAAKVATKVREAVQSPLAMYELTEGDNKDVTFGQSLPNEPLRLFFKHAQDVLAGYYTPELKGALASTNNQWSWAKFHETDRAKRRFFEDFTTAYNALTFKPEEKPPAEVAGSAAREEQNVKKG